MILTRRLWKISILMTQVSGLIYDSLSDVLIIQSSQSSNDLIDLDWGLQALLTPQLWKRLPSNNRMDNVYLIDNDRYYSLFLIKDVSIRWDKLLVLLNFNNGLQRRIFLKLKSWPWQIA